MVSIFCPFVRPLQKQKKIDNAGFLQKQNQTPLQH